MLYPAQVAGFAKETGRGQAWRDHSQAGKARRRQEDAVPRSLTGRFTEDLQPDES